MATISKSSEQTTVTQIDLVVKDLQARPDYGKDQQETIKLLNSYKVLLIKDEAAPTPKLSVEIKTLGEGSVLPSLAEIISDNTVLSKSQPLSTASNVPASMAKKHNINLEALQSDVQGITVQAGLSDSQSSGGTDSQPSDDPKDKDISPEQAADELLVELMRSTVFSDPGLVAAMQRLSGSRTLN